MKIVPGRPYLLMCPNVEVQEVTPREFVGKGPIDIRHPLLGFVNVHLKLPCWTIDKDVYYPDTFSNYRVPIPVAPERYLYPIDGDLNRDEREEEKTKGEPILTLS